MFVLGLSMGMFPEAAASSQKGVRFATHLPHHQPPGITCKSNSSLASDVSAQYLDCPGSIEQGGMERL